MTKRGLADMRHNNLDGFRCSLSEMLAMRLLLFVVCLGSSDFVLLYTTHTVRVRKLIIPALSAECDNNTL